MVSGLALSAIPVSDQLVLQRADVFFTGGTGLSSRLIHFFTRGIGKSRSPRLIPNAVFLLTLLPSQATMLPAQSEKDVATLEEADALCRAGSVKKAKKKFSELIKRFPTWSEPLYQLGLCQHRAGQFQQARETFEKVLSMDPEHKAAKSNFDLVAYLDRVSYREILSSVTNLEYDHAVDLIEASIQKGEDPDRLLRELASSFALGSREDFFYRPITELFVKRKLWDAALTLLDLWETDRPETAPEAKARRGWVYVQTDQSEQAKRVYDELVSFYTKPEGTFLGPLNFFEHFGTRFKRPKLLSKSTPAYTDAAIKNKIRGQILCRVIVEVDGSISQPQVIKGLGYGLDKSALRELQQWRFAPGTLNGKPIRVLVTIVVAFNLR